MPQSYYVAPIALTEDLVKGATVSGTINGVQVSGTVGAGNVSLYASSGGSLKVAEIGSDAGNYQIALKEQPESDLTIHLTQTAPAHAVTIPEEYLELTETNAAIETAQNAANTAQNAANTAQNVANTAQNVANTAQNAANTAQNAAGIAAVTALILTITWDGTTIGKTTFTTSKAEKFYKVSPLEIPVRAFTGTYKNNYVNAQKLRPIEHDGWYRHGNNVIVVLKPGTYTTDTLVGSFTASEPGVYLRDADGSPYVLNISSEPDVYYNAMFMMSGDGTKKFRITVDDTGTIKATEVTI